MSQSLYYTTTNNERSGRASHYYKAEQYAGQHAAAQNAKAEKLGIKARYSVADCASDGIDAKDIRDSYAGA